jgi:hypothetical protein
LSAVELQKDCIQQIQKELLVELCGSLNLKSLHFLNLFDVVLCIDAAYHSELNLFLDSVSSVLDSKGRIAFHYLMWSDDWQHCSYLQKQQYRCLLKAADVTWRNLMNGQQLSQTLAQHGFKDIVIQDFSEPVLNGFAQYIETQSARKRPFGFAQLKIAMTANCVKNSIKMV